MSEKTGGENLLELTENKRQRAWADRNRLRALQKRTVQNVKAQGGIAHLAKRLNVNVEGVIKPMPPVLRELSDAETNHHYLELQCQKYKLLQRRMTDEEYAENAEKLRQQAADLMKGKS